jgi:hypothetical protein
MAKSVQALIMTANLQPGTRFELDQIFMLDDERMDALEDGRDAPLARGDFWLDLHERERVIEDGALAIAIRRSWYHGPETPEYPLRMYTEPKRRLRVESDPRVDRVDHLALNTRVARFRAEPPVLAPFSNVSLGAMLEVQRREHAPASSFDFLEWDLPIDPTPEAVAAAERGQFAGLWEVCSCGEWSDVSSFVLVQDFIPILRVGTNYGDPWRVEAFPAKLDAAAAGVRRIERAEREAKRQVAGRPAE